MIVTFSCPVSTNITMFGDVAVRLLKMMGHSGTVPSAILPADVPAALERLEAAIAEDAKHPAPDPSPADEDAVTQPISLQTRAGPLIEMLEVASKEAQRVTWA